MTQKYELFFEPWKYRYASRPNKQRLPAIFRKFILISFPRFLQSCHLNIWTMALAQAISAVLTFRSSRKDRLPLLLRVPRKRFNDWNSAMGHPRPSISHRLLNSSRFKHWLTTYTVYGQISQGFRNDPTECNGRKQRSPHTTPVNNLQKLLSRRMFPISV